MSIIDLEVMVITAEDCGIDAVNGSCIFGKVDSTVSFGRSVKFNGCRTNGTCTESYTLFDFGKIADPQITVGQFDFIAVII